MSHKQKKKELIFREEFPELPCFIDSAIPILKNFIKDQIKYCIRDSILIAEERNVSNCNPIVTPSDVTEAVNAIKTRHPINKRNKNVIFADIMLVLSSLGAESVFTFNIYEKSKEWAYLLLLITIVTFICTSFYKIFRDSNYTGKGA